MTFRADCLPMGHFGTTTVTDATDPPVLLLLLRSGPARVSGPVPIPLFVPEGRACARRPSRQRVRRGRGRNYCAGRAGRERTPRATAAAAATPRPAELIHSQQVS